MDPLNFLDKLRQKPEPLRRALAFWVAVGITAVIGVIWVSSLGGRFSSAGSDTENAATPFDQVKDLFK